MYQDYNELKVEKRDKILIIKFSNPKKKNCVNRICYQEIARALTEASKDEGVTLIAFTGEGEYFSAGNDLSQSGNVTDLEAYIQEANVIFKKFISAFINCTKIIVSVVNGPSIGIATTMAGLSDINWCSETAYFLTPFTKLGIVPEACSTYLFPLLLGRSKAGEMLYFGEKLSAIDAYHFNFVSRVFKLDELDTVIWPKLHEFSELPPGALKASKKLMRAHEKESLLRALDAESMELYERFHTEEFVKAIVEFSSRKRKSKL